MAFPQIPRHFSQRSLKLPLELMGAELIEVLVTPNSIVETLDAPCRTPAWPATGGPCQRLTVEAHPAAHYMRGCR